MGRARACCLILDPADRLLARLMGLRPRDGRLRARRLRRAGPARRCPGAGGGSRQRPFPRMRLLCRLRSEVAVRTRGKRMPVRRPRPPRRPVDSMAELRLLDPRKQSPGSHPGGRCDPVRPRLSTRRAQRHGACVARGAGGAGLGMGTRARGRSRRRPRLRPRGAQARRSSRGAAQTPMPRCSGSPTLGSSFAAFPVRGWFAPRSARGPPRAMSTLSRASPPHNRDASATVNREPATLGAAETVGQRGSARHCAKHPLGMGIHVDAGPARESAQREPPVLCQLDRQRARRSHPNEDRSARNRGLLDELE